MFCVIKSYQQLKFSILEVSYSTILLRFNLRIKCNNLCFVIMVYLMIKIFVTLGAYQNYFCILNISNT